MLFCKEEKHQSAFNSPLQVFVAAVLNEKKIKATVVKLL